MSISGADGATGALVVRDLGSLLKRVAVGDVAVVDEDVVSLDSRGMPSSSTRDCSLKCVFGPIFSITDCVIGYVNPGVVQACVRG